MYPDCQRHVRRRGNGLGAVSSTDNPVSREAIEEVRLQSTAFAPEFGRAAGGQVAIATRSGTGEYRGGLFSELRHEALAANDWFANQRGFGARRCAIRMWAASSAAHSEATAHTFFSPTKPCACASRKWP